MKLIMRPVGEPDFEPVSLGQLRDHIRLDDNADDAAVLGFGVTARESIEKALGFPVLSTTVTGSSEGWPDARLIIDAPVTSIDTVTYTAVGGVETDWTGWVARTSQGGVTALRPATGQSWPELGDDPIITVTAKAGFVQVPESIVTAICMLAAYLNANRDGIGQDAMNRLPRPILSLVRPYSWRLIG
jgi:uncharacterized phiE125 gp8 family phage protein